jgi:PAS domain-containing protein
VLKLTGRAAEGNLMAVVESSSDQLAGPLSQLIDAKYALADPAGRITRWGAGATALFGVGSEQMVGRSLFDGVLGGDDGGWHAFAGGDGKGATLAVDLDIKRPDGQSVQCAVQLVPVNLADGLDVSFLAADLTGGREPAERRLDALRLRHERALSVLERTLADGPSLEDGDRLAGLIAIFGADVPAPGAGEEALERAARAERELTDLRAPLEQARAETRALADRLQQLEADLRGRIDDARAAAEEARTESAQARAESERARTEAAEARGSAEQARGENGQARGDTEQVRAEVEQALAAAEQAREQAERARAEAELARSEAEQGRREAQQARRELRGAQALGAAASPAGFFTYDGQLGEPDRAPRAGFDDAAEPIAKLGLDGSFMELNARFRDLVGYTEEEFANARWPSSADRDRIGEQRALLHALAAGEAEHGPVDSTYMHREGLLVQLSGRIQLVRSESGAPDHLLLTLDGR